MERSCADKADMLGDCSVFFPPSLPKPVVRFVIRIGFLAPILPIKELVVIAMISMHEPLGVRGLGNFVLQKKRAKLKVTATTGIINGRCAPM